MGGLVVVNFANVGATYATKVLGRGGSKGDRLFDWEGVRKCVNYIREELDMQVVGCIYENYWGPDNDVQQVEGVPEDIRRKCLSIQETPRLTGKNHKSADDEMTIKCAYRRNCRLWTTTTIVIGYRSFAMKRCDDGWKIARS